MATIKAAATVNGAVWIKYFGAIIKTHLHFIENIKIKDHAQRQFIGAARFALAGASWPPSA